MEFGYHHSSFQYDDRPMAEATVERAAWLDDEGFTWFSLMDHLWQLSGNGQRDGPFLDAYTALPAVARETDDIELGALVTCPHYRYPGYLARALASLDHLSGGRAVLGIGGGWYEAEYEALGIEFPDAPERLRQMRDVIELCKAAWTRESPVDYEGRYYDLDGLYLEPKPVQDPHPPVLIGGGGEQLTLRATAHHGDRWNIPWGDPDAYADKLDVLREHCEAYDRDLSEITATVANVTVIRETTEAAHETYERLLQRTEGGPTPREEYRGAVGTPAEVASLLERFDDVGLDQFMLKVPSNDRRTVELFVDEVMDDVA